MPAYWMISNRIVKKDGFGDVHDKLSFWTSSQGPLTQFKNWKPVSADKFKQLLVAAADQFPPMEHGENENQSHVTFFVHGYNNGWRDAATRYEKLCGQLYEGEQ